jgi:hypothetical protein
MHRTRWRPTVRGNGVTEHEQAGGVDHPTPGRAASVKATLAACSVTAIVSIGASVGLTYALVGSAEPGPQGEPGVTGARGPVGQRGPAGVSGSVDEEEVWSVVEGDPARAAAAVQDELEPSPADAQDDAARVASDLGDLCSSLRLMDALADEFISCP